MDALLSSLVAAFLAEWGDKTQLLLVALAARYRTPLPILLGAAAAALANALIAAGGGIFVHDLIATRAAALLLALGLLFAGVAGLFRPKRPDMGAGWRVGPFVTSAICFFLLEFGDKTQFITFGVAARFDSLWFAVAGATAGVAAAGLPAVLLAESLPKSVPLRPIRLGVAALFLVVGFIVAVNALRLT